MDAVRPGSNREGPRLASHEALERTRDRDASHRVRLSVEWGEYEHSGVEKATRRSSSARQAAVPPPPPHPKKTPPRQGFAAPVAPATRRGPAFRQSFWLVVLATALAMVMPLRAEEPAPRVGAPQQPGAVHTVRQIPEACVRLEGRYAQPGSDDPYALQVVPVGGNCQARARFVEGAEARPSSAGGWVLNDVIRIPEASCPGREAVVRVWRKAGDALPARDGQGQARVYLEQGRSQAAAAAGGLTRFSAELEMPSGRCG